MLSCRICGSVTGQHGFSFCKRNSEPEIKTVPQEDRYETISILIKAKDDGTTWFDTISDLISENCTPLEDPDNVPDDYECPCGLLSMGGTSGTLEQCYDHERVTEKWAGDVQASDLKRILAIVVDYLEPYDHEAYQRLWKAAYWWNEF